MKGFLPVFLALLCGCGESGQGDNPETKTAAKATGPSNPQSIPAKSTPQATKAEPKPIPTKSSPKTTKPVPQPIPAKPKPTTPNTPTKTPPTKPSPKTTKTKPKTPTTTPAPKTTKTKPKTPTKTPGKDGKKKSETNKGQTKPTLQQRWTLLVSSARQGQWPNYQVVQQNLGRPNQQKQNVTMNPKAILGPRKKSVINPQAQALPRVAPCIRWDYFDSPKGQDSIQLYFYNGSLAGFHWVKNTKKTQGNKTASNKPRNKGAGKSSSSKPNNGAAQAQQLLQRRWALLVGTVNQGQWPNYQVIQQNLGQPNQQKQNVTMNTRAILNSKDKGAVNPVARSIPAVSPCIRWDYFGAPKGQESLQLYFYNGSLAGFQWVKNTKKNQGNKTGGKKLGNKNRGKGKSGKAGTKPR